MFLLIFIDLFLQDVQMPVMGGFEATALIRKYEQDHGLKPTPIIALTAHAMVGYRVSSLLLQMITLTSQLKCLQAGMTDYLTKPISKTRLLKMVRKCITSALL